MVVDYGSLSFKLRFSIVSEDRNYNQNKQAEAAECKDPFAQPRHGIEPSWNSPASMTKPVDGLSDHRDRSDQGDHE